MTWSVTITPMRSAKVRKIASALAARGGDGNPEPRIPQYRFANLELQGIVVNQQYLAPSIHDFTFTFHEARLCTRTRGTAAFRVFCADILAHLRQTRQCISRLYFEEDDVVSQYCYAAQQHSSR